MANSHGGARAGAGRKPRAETHAPKIKAAEKRIADHLPELIENLFVLAGGVRVEKTDKEGWTHVYTTPPDRQANEYLINRVMGKPTEKTEVSGMDGGPIGVQVQVYLPENGRDTTACEPNSAP